MSQNLQRLRQACVHRFRRGTEAAERRAEKVFWPVPGWPTHTQLFLAAVGVVAALTVAVVVLRVYVWEPHPEVDPDVIALVPFALSGTCSAEASLAESLVGWAGASLATDEGPYAADPDVVNAAWRDAGGTPADPLSSGAAIEVARSAAAGRVIVGRCHGTGEQRRLTAGLWEVPTGARVATASVTGSAESLESMVGQLVRELVDARGGVIGDPRP